MRKLQWTERPYADARACVRELRETMPKGPNGQHRPAEAIGCAVTVAKIATGEMEETKPSSRRVAGLNRAQALSPEQRSEIARKAARARWAKPTQAA